MAVGLAALRDRARARGRAGQLPGQDAGRAVRDLRKDWLFQPFVRDEESRDLLHEAAAFIGEKHRELAGRFGLDVPEGPGPAA